MHDIIEVKTCDLASSEQEVAVNAVKRVHNWFVIRDSKNEGM